MAVFVDLYSKAKIDELVQRVMQVPGLMEHASSEIWSIYFTAPSDNSLRRRTKLRPTASLPCHVSEYASSVTTCWSRLK